MDLVVLSIKLLAHFYLCPLANFRNIFFITKILPAIIRPIRVRQLLGSFIACRVGVTLNTDLQDNDQIVNVIISIRVPQIQNVLIATFIITRIHFKADAPFFFKNRESFKYGVFCQCVLYSIQHFVLKSQAEQC